MNIIQALEAAYGDHVPKKTCVYIWIGRFKADKLFKMKNAMEDQKPQAMMKMLILLEA